MRKTEREIKDILDIVSVMEKCDVCRLALNIIGILVSTGSRIGGVIGWAAGIIALGCLILTIMGIVRAVKLSDEPLPIIGNFRIF